MHSTEEPKSLPEMVLDTIKEGIWVTDADDRIVLFNHGMERISGASASSVVGLSVLHDFPVETIGEILPNYLCARKTLKPVAYEARVITPGKCETIQAGYLSPRVEEGHFAGMICTAEEVTETRRIERAHREAGERATRYLEFTPNLIVVALNCEGNITFLNTAGARILSCQPGEVLGKNWFDTFVPEDVRAKMKHIFAQIVQGKRDLIAEHEREVLTCAGIRMVHWYNALDRDAAGNILGLLCSGQDVTEHRRAQAALRETQSILHAAMEQSQAGIAIAEAPSGRLRYVNRAGLLIRGADHASVVENIDINQYVSRWQLMDLDGTPLAADAVPLTRAITLGEENSREFIIRRSEKDDRVVYAQAAPIFDDHGQIVAGVVVFQDLTERRQAEAAQREAQQILEGILESITVRVFWKDKHLVYLGCNSAFARDAGFDDPRDIIGKDDYALSWQGQAELYRRDDYEVIESGKPKLLIEELLTRSDGKLITLLTGKVPLRDKRGEISGVLGTYMDITARKEAEEAHAKSHALLENLARLVPGVIYQYRLYPDGRSAFPYASPGINEIYEVTPEAVQHDATPVFSRLHPEDIDCVSQAILESAQRLEAFRCEFRVVLPRQGLRWRRCEALPVRTEDGGTLWHGIITDITDRKQAEVEQEKLRAQLSQSQKLESIGRLAGGVAHDFNNMLNVILGHAEMTLEDLPEESPLRNDIEEIKKSAERSAELTRQLLAFARKQTISPKTLNLNETVASMLKMLRRLIGEYIELVWLPVDAKACVSIDPAQIDQMLANLIVNARDAIGHQGGKITIETGRAVFDGEYCAEHAGYNPGEYIMLAVSDTGCGMDQALLGNIFEPFFTTKGVGEGTGLGLATVYGIVMQNHGFITVHSEPGLGSTFRIYLPERQMEVAGGTSSEAAPLARGEETILLVEDEPTILAMTKTMLQRLGYEVLDAATPGEALRLAREHEGEIQLLISDVVMPEMNGSDLANTLLLLYPNLKHIFISGYTADVIGQQGVLDEAVNFIQKPFSRRTLATKVREVLGIPASPR